ncbi:MAG: DUF2318 domain-containing protein [Bacillota bacterium]|nr:DUF2318 domain-containing protein [Bacillota bacterium]
MGNNKQIPQKEMGFGKAKKYIAAISGIAIIIIAVFFIVKGNSEGNTKITSASTDLVIQKNEVTDTAKFYPLKTGETNMEIMAVKASDGSIRTAFNTCQVCNGSPKAYYKQEGDVLVCQNCGNRFKMDMIEQQRGGCNPVPIMKENKTEDGSKIVISKDFIEENKGLFADNWKK